MPDDPRDEYIMSLLELMAEKNFLPPGPDSKELEADYLGWALNLKARYLEDKKNAEGKAEDSKERKAFEQLQEDLSKALPNLTKGTLAAISAFQKNDPFTGTAAIMDMCATLAPLLASLSAAGGPPGMVVGAIFSMIGQILSFFAPKSESLSSQIQKMLAEMRADEKEVTIQSTQNMIT